jgi:dephospho-CoA kinase
MQKVGLTGGIATGKNVITDFFEALGAKIIDADKIAREVIQKGTPAYQKIIKAFGNNILKSDGEIDRPRLASLVFKDPDKLDILNRITHPEIIMIENTLSDDYIKTNPKSIIIINAALIIEAKTYERFDKIILVFASIKTQIDRIMKRNNMTQKEASKRIKSQMSFEEKKKFADYIIDNDGDVEATKSQCNRIYSELVESEGKMGADV